MEKEQITWVETLEIAAIVCGIDPDSDMDAHEAALAEKFEIEPLKFEQILQQLFDRIDFGVSPLTQEAFVGFAREEGEFKAWMLKKDCNQEFIQSVIGWISEGKKLSEENPELVKTITSKGKPIYEVVLRNSTPEINKDPENFRIKYKIYFHKGPHAGKTKIIYMDYEDIECYDLAQYLIEHDFLTVYTNMERYFDVKEREYVFVQ